MNISIMHSNGCDYVKLEDYEQLAKELGENKNQRLIANAKAAGRAAKIKQLQAEVDRLRGIVLDLKTHISGNSDMFIDGMLAEALQPSIDPKDYDGPDQEDGHDCEGFPGGCERFGCPSGEECTMLQSSDIKQENE